MKKHIKLIVFVISLLIVFFTYSIFINKNSKVYYVALGDSIAEGYTPYHEVDYGYTDYVADYLKKENNLSFFTKRYAKSGYTIEDLKRDIDNNKEIEIDNKKYYLKQVLRESDLVTLTIGANDFIKGMSLDDIPTKLLDTKNIKSRIDELVKDFNDLLILIKQYAKEEIIVTGYYNPLPRMELYKDSIDEIVKYYNNLIEEICVELDVIYVDVFDDFAKDIDVLPNPLDIHPNKKGYEIISKKIIEKIEELTK